MTRREKDPAKAGRFLARALVVVGGAAAACALAWLTATASASTVTQITDGPLGMAAPVLPAVPELPSVDPARLADLVQSQVPQAIPAAVAAVGRIAATGPTELDSPAKDPRDHAEKASLSAARPIDAPPALVDSVPRERPAEPASATVPVRVVTTTGPLPADLQAEHGGEDPGGRSWPPPCSISANAGPASGQDRGYGDVVLPDFANQAQSVRCRNGVSHRDVVSAEIRPGVTPD
ncbi:MULTISPECIES: hypothetical protein [unclassified Amycolatopsis]|uniref:hypothetical protein n=1 Tax=unclassified Amycolatopsis TaxID=2618356 RepID=UPI002875B4C5|nr:MULTISPECIES: hypothetical protein [unclassified Amycolatopsis]MDS0137524.1 hypothetical protein [Amycolatopsis sp. 505]MDS0141719.1 hypothetical protein [Amycolatopsis sp. CM201R]